MLRRYRLPGPYTLVAGWILLRTTTFEVRTRCDMRHNSLRLISSYHTGTRHLLDLAATSSHRAKLLFCSSLASVLNSASLDDPIPEQLSSSPSTSIPIGYSQSKWVTEQICGKAASTALHNRVQVLRIGQLCGDVEHGIWNESEGWPLMLRTAGTTGKLPKLNEVRSQPLKDPLRRRLTPLLVVTQDPSWLPVDIAASAV
jgi:thioester reductase-like protein